MGEDQFEIILEIKGAHDSSKTYAKSTMLVGKKSALTFLKHFLDQQTEMTKKQLDETKKKE